MMDSNFRHYGIMIDNSRNAVMKPEAVKQMIDLLEKMGYNSLMLYTEDTYEVNNQPYFGYLRGRYTKEEIKELDAYGREHGVELIPCIQTLAHLNAIMRWSYSSYCDTGDILCVGEEKTYQLIEDMFATIDECFTSKTINIGMDEAHMIGRGTYLDKHGYRERVDIFMEHLARVSEIAKKYDFTLCMWSDMFYRMTAGSYENFQGKHEIDRAIMEKIPENVKLIYWDYYSTDEKHYDDMIENHQMLQDDIWFAGGLWTWAGYAPHNTYGIKSSIPAVTSCRKYGVKDVVFTAWGDNGGECSRFAVLPVLFYNACLGKGITDEAEIKQKFEEMFEIAFDDFMLLDLPGTPNQVEGIASAEKYLLYNDCFLGLFDKTVRDGDAESYAACAARLERLVKHPRWGWLFDAMKTLCDLLSVKADIGIKTRKAYQKGDKDELARLIPEYDRILVNAEAFYVAYEKQWMLENKPHGFDVQDLRIGGMQKRVLHCKKRLEAYVNGELASLPELEELLLDIEGGGVEGGGRPLFYNSWSLSSTVNTL